MEGGQAGPSGEEELQGSQPAVTPGSWGLCHPVGSRVVCVVWPPLQPGPNGTPRAGGGLARTPGLKQLPPVTCLCLDSEDQGFAGQLLHTHPHHTHSQRGGGRARRTDPLSLGWDYPAGSTCHRMCAVCAFPLPGRAGPSPQLPLIPILSPPWRLWEHHFRSLGTGLTGREPGLGLWSDQREPPDASGGWPWVPSWAC